MITTEQQALLASIQSLAAAGRGQTGWSIKHHVEFDANGHTRSTVTAFFPGRPPADAYLSWATIDPKGNDTAEGMTPEFVAEHECTLAQQRDKLAAWIAEHRIDKEAA
ncbi:hypothetical protein [Halomonas sp. B23F22_10]|uniref:hypothetical protein n=1 Tax=Halomonas sp. B23F22_10 TaxID=3459515 RepID=UPI00373EECED